MKPDTTAAGMREKMERAAWFYTNSPGRAFDCIEDVLATLPVSLQELADIADGRKRVVPVEPTEAMVVAGYEVASHLHEQATSWDIRILALNTFKAMLTAAPKDPAP